MGSTVEISSSFVEGAPPGELNEVINDIKTLTADLDPALVTKLKPAFQRYNESQLTTVKLPGAVQPVLVSEYNRLSDSSYYDTASSTSFDFDHVTQKASNSRSHSHGTSHSSLVQSTLKSLATYFTEHYPTSPTAAFTVAQSPNNSNEIVILLSTTKSSPSNFISGRWKSVFTYSPSSRILSGQIAVNVHYYEDGNVALRTTKKIGEITDVEATGSEIVRRIAAIEKQYQEELNRALVSMNETSFKGLRRQLPVTRQKIEWEMIKSYGALNDVRGGR